MPDPSDASTITRVSRLLRDCRIFTDPALGGAPRGDAAGVSEWCAAHPWRQAERDRIRRESDKLGEILRYLNSRREGESLKAWRAR